MKILMEPSKNIRQLVYYNERKLRTGDACYVCSGNCLKDVEGLNVAEKTKIFRRAILLNQTAEWNALHIFLEFSPAEQLSDGKMAEVAMRYMEGIGFGRQPWLAYRHLDAAFPHLHIVTTNIRWDGQQINCYLLAPRRSEPIRKAIEQQFGLARGKPTGLALPGHDPTAKIQYGKVPTTKAIGESLQYILPTYKYRSLEELNAILCLYNLKAIGGQPASMLHMHHGLLYQILGDDGKGRGAPIKASAISFKPVLAWLEKRFEANQGMDASALSRVRFGLDGILRDRPAGSRELLGALRRKQVSASPVFGGSGEVDRLLFVDLASKAVFSSVDLGSGYGAAAIRERLGFDPFPAAPKRGRRRRSAEPTTTEQRVESQQIRQKRHSRHL